MTVLREAGYRTVLVSPFPERHAAWHVLDGFREWFNSGGHGHERADEVYPYVEQWLTEYTQEKNWYLHLNFWDPHTLYTTPLGYGNPFADDPAPEWLTQEIIDDQRESTGPFSARDLFFYDEKGDLPETADERMPEEIASPEDFKQFVDGYDTSIRYMDDYIGHVFDLLSQMGVFENTLIIVSADHGENLGELNVYGDHTTADEATCRLPLVVHGPEIEPGVDNGFHYQLDLGPTLVELANQEPAPRWNGRSFAASLTDGEPSRAIISYSATVRGRASVRFASIIGYSYVHIIILI